MKGSTNFAGFRGRELGWASGLSLAFLYTLFFSLIAAILFFLAYRSMERTIHDRELALVKNRALEYRAWYLTGQLEVLESRIDEQSIDSGDIMFVHVDGPGIDYINVHAPGGDPISPEDIRNLEGMLEGHDIEFAGERWIVASVPLNDSGLILQAGKNSRSSDAILASLRTVFVWVFIPAVLLACLGGTFITYHKLSPIRRLVIGMSNILKSGDLSQRVEPEKNRNELNALVKLFNQLLVRNESLIGAMRQSLDHIAHDFRTPLSRINITAQQTLQKENDPQKLRDALADCAEESDHLKKLLETLMDVAEAEAGAMKLQLNSISLPDLIVSAVELYEFVAEEKGVTITTQLPDECFATVDQVRMTQVLANLLDNAIKYSPGGGEICIALKPGSEATRIEITDQGIGISETDLSSIWDRLFRAEMSRSTTGMGLGLSFVKAIVEAHGGSVSVQSQIGKGSTFLVELPQPCENPSSVHCD